MASMSHSPGAPSGEPPQSTSPAATIYQHPLAYLIGLQGVALMKAFAGEFDRQFTAARLTEVRALLDAAEVLGEGVEVPPMSSVDGYDGWAPTYDDPGNGIFEIEEPIVHPILDRLPVGVAVDAACGTGRHTARLAERGHQVHGFDTSSRMLAVARAKVPGARFAAADLRSLPLPDSSVDLVVCALSLAHVEHLEPVFREAARVLRTGGHLVISDTRGHFIGSTLYPLIKWDLQDRLGYIPTWRHATSDYLRAALPNRFKVRDCHEPLRPQPLVDLSSPPTPALRENPDEPPNIWDLQAWAPDATNATYQTEPCLIVWDLELEQDST
jgi:SAM-dependent methyltransferase